MKKQRGQGKKVKELKNEKTKMSKITTQKKSQIMKTKRKRRRRRKQCQDETGNESIRLRLKKEKDENENKK